MITTDRPAAFWLAWQDEEPWATGPGDTIPVPPPSAGRYSIIASRGERAPASRVRACRRTDPCIVPPPGSDRMGVAEVEGRVAILPPPWAPVRPGASNNEGKG